MKYSKEFIIGFISLLAIFILYWGATYLKGGDVFSSSTKIYAVYPKVDGLSKSQPVIISGFQVGTITNMIFHPSMDGRIVVEMTINTDYPINKNSVARITSTDLLGGKAIDLVSDKPGELVQNGDTLISDISLSLSEEVNLQVAPLRNKVEKLLGSVDTVLTLTTEIFTEDFKNNIESSVGSIRATIASLEKSARSFEKLMIDNEENLTQTVNDVGEVSHVLQMNKMNLDKIARNLAAVSDSLIESNPGQAFRSLTSTLVNFNDLLARVEQGEGNLGLLLNDEDLFNNLELASDRMNLLLLDMQLNPKRYVNFSIFGRSKKVDAEELNRLHNEDKRKREQKRDERK